MHDMAVQREQQLYTERRIHSSIANTLLDRVETAAYNLLGQQLNLSDHQNDFSDAIKPNSTRAVSP